MCEMWLILDTWRVNVWTSWCRPAETWRWWGWNGWRGQKYSEWEREWERERARERGKREREREKERKRWHEIASGKAIINGAYVWWWWWWKLTLQFSYFENHIMYSLLFWWDIRAFVTNEVNLYLLLILILEAGTTIRKIIVSTVKDPSLYWSWWRTFFDGAMWVRSRPEMLKRFSSQPSGSWRGIVGTHSSS